MGHRQNGSQALSGFDDVVVADVEAWLKIRTRGRWIEGSLPVPHDTRHATQHMMIHNN